MGVVSYKPLCNANLGGLKTVVVVIYTLYTLMPIELALSVSAVSNPWLPPGCQIRLMRGLV